MNSVSTYPGRPAHVPHDAIITFKGEQSVKAVSMCPRTYRTQYSVQLEDGEWYSPRRLAEMGRVVWRVYVGKFRALEWPHKSASNPPLP